MERRQLYQSKLFEHLISRVAAAARSMKMTTGGGVFGDVRNALAIQVIAPGFVPDERLEVPDFCGFSVFQPLNGWMVRNAISSEAV